MSLLDEMLGQQGSEPALSRGKLAELGRHWVKPVPDGERVRQVIHPVPAWAMGVSPVPCPCEMHGPMAEKNPNLFRGGFPFPALMEIHHTEAKKKHVEAERKRVQREIDELFMPKHIAREIGLPARARPGYGKKSKSKRPEGGYGKFLRQLGGRGGVAAMAIARLRGQAPNPLPAEEQSRLFHGEPHEVLRIHGRDKVVLGDLTELGYRTPPASKRSGPEWIHRSGDRGLGKLFGSSPKPKVLADARTGVPELYMGGSPMRFRPLLGLFG